MNKHVDLSLKSIPTAIYACFVLHNYCEFNKCAVHTELVMTQIENHKKDRLTNPNQNTVFSGNLDEGEAVRDVLLASVQAVVGDEI